MKGHVSLGHKKCGWRVFHLSCGSKLPVSGQPARLHFANTSIFESSAQFVEPN